MSWKNKLFRLKNPYDLTSSNRLFLAAMKENCKYQYDHCADYKRILDEMHFHPNDLREYKDLERLPFLPTLYFKKHTLFSMEQYRMLIKATSSGTSGRKSYIGFNFSSLWRGLSMVITVGKYHHLWSLNPVHYLISAISWI